MTNNKKTINKIKTENFIKKFPIIFLLQYNNFTVNDWFDLRQKIQEQTNQSRDFHQKKSDIEILNIKNSLLKKIVQSSSEIKHVDSLDFLFQGPTCLIGCKNEKHLQTIWDCINSNPKLLFISCLYKNHLLNHLDFEILLKTNFSIYQTLLQNLDKKTELYNLLQQSLNIQPLISIPQNCLTVLTLLK